MAITNALGRPKDQTKRNAIVNAARGLFFTRGFAATTLEAVAEAANVSKVTVYGHFGDKAGVFEAVVQAIASRIEAGFAVESAPEADLAGTLMAFGRALMHEIMSAEMMNFERHMSGELVQHPELARRFFEAGPGYMRAKLAKIIAEAHDRKQIKVDDPVIAANDLCGLWQGFSRPEALFGVANAPSADEIQQRVAHGVTLFLKAYATP